MGFIRRLVYATLLPEKLRDAIKIEELMKLNETKKNKK